MTVTITLTPELETKLREQATALGKDVSTFVQEAVEEKLGLSQQETCTESAEEFDRVLEEFYAENPESVPSLPADFSRADIYSDHD